MDRINGVLAEPAEPLRASTAPETTASSGEPVIRFDSVRFGYVPEREVLRGVSFEVPALSRAALVGPSGAGKSVTS